MSVNLNTEGFESGEFQFLKLTVRYRPPIGTGIIFSCLVVREALHVRSDTRYVFWEFFGNG